ncbi:MAG: hypothetical protein JSV62_02540 [Promethearchaeota archaeon]|nr:MAG: hypothetical protein JSV62_02540 [Candidatus Lokiarchaeota archaeon]
MMEPNNNLFEILRIIDAKSINQFKIFEDVIHYFNPQYSEFKKLGLDTSNLDKSFIELKKEHTKEIRVWGKKFLTTCPIDLQDAFIHISRHATSFPQLNLRPYVVFKYSWKLFFKKFPNGRIILVNFPSDYYNILLDELDPYRISEFEDDSDDDFIKSYPHEFSGCLSTEFPYIAFNLMANGIPTRILGTPDFQYGVLLYYVPDITISYSQILDSSFRNQHVLNSFTHIFSDDLSQHMPMQGTILLKKDFPKPHVQMEYYKWFINIVNLRVKDFLKIQDIFKREQLVMTINRAMCEAQLCIIHMLPYLSKILFFNCLDKLANFNTAIENGIDEAQSFKQFFNIDFLENVVLQKLKEIPDDIGDFIRNLLNEIIIIIQDDNLNPNYMRALRNSVHGYHLYENNLQQLMERSADVNNFIVNLVIPLIFYYLLLDWTID